MSKNMYIIGRDIRSDISIPVRSVSRKHLIIKKEENTWYIIDNNSGNGTFLNSYDNRIEKELLKKDETLYLSTYKLSTNRIFSLIQGEEKLQKVTVDSKKMTLGRNPKSDIFIDNPNISFNHAQIIRENLSYYIYDLNSTNGTFVNEMDVEEKCKVKSGDKISLGLYSFIFNIEEDDNVSMINMNRGGFRLDIKDISFVVKTKDENKKNIDKSLLDDISLSIFPGEMVGVMGLSGAGKTTLLKILSGYSKPTKGEVFINGKDLYLHYNRIKNFIGYVPQDDIVHPELTVYEALYYSSKLRLSSDLTDIEINIRIEKVLKELGIYKTANVLIGSPDTQKGISGGQRKRVNIAMELLANPELIFLDEPTSGLSSVDTKIVMDKLKSLSDKGKTIILTIHQPSLENYKKMDNIVILTQGKMAYFGATYPESIKFFNEGSNSEELLSQPDNALLGLYDGEENNKDWTSIYNNSLFYDKFVVQRLESDKDVLMKPFEKDLSNSFFSQFKVLSSRYLTIKRKDSLNMVFLLAQAPIIAFFLVFLFASNNSEQYHKTPSVLLFILLISAIWFGVINSVREIVSEKAIYERERLLGLKLLPYVFSKYLILALLSLIQVLLLVFIVDGMVGLTLNIGNAILIVFMTALIGISIGLFISSISKTSAFALTVVPIVLLPMIMFGGGILPVNKMSTSAYVASYVMPIRWSLEESIRSYDNNESNQFLREPIEQNLTTHTLIYNNDEVRNLAGEGEEAVCEDRRCIEELYIKKEYADNNKEVYIFRNHSSSLIYIILFLFIIIPLLFTILVLRRKDKH